MIVQDEPLDDNALQFLHAQRRHILDLSPARPWHYWELHNPWGRSAQNTDSWGFLDLCQDRRLIDPVREIIGPDIILYDSQFLPDKSLSFEHLAGTWTSDAPRCPSQPRAGAVARIILPAEGENTTSLVLSDKNHHKEQAIPMVGGTIIVHDIHLHYRYNGICPGKTPLEYVIRYIPASSKYIREQNNDFYQNLNILSPLQNYAAMPIWLVSGEDRMDNDFVTGFKPLAGQWTNAQW